jgi:hypothetical protein
MKVGVFNPVYARLGVAASPYGVFMAGPSPRATSRA